MAALAVFLEHAGGRLFGSFRSFHTNYFQLGQFGVSCFFLCSGFVIPYTLERHSSLKRFWVNRFFRLYPLYWVSLAFALGLYAVGLFELPAPFLERFWLSVGGNLTMLQGWAGLSHAVSPYWSLGYEMIFYCLASLLFFSGLSRRTASVLVGLLILSVANPILFRFVLQRHVHPGLVFHFATLFFGTLVFRFHEGQVRRRHFAAFCIAAFVTIIAVSGFSFYGQDEPAASGTRSFLPLLSAWLAAYAVFLTAYTSRRSRWAGCAVRLGWVSYSFYLFHPLVISAIPELHSPWLSLASWLVSTWLVAEFGYGRIERPAIECGKRWVALGAN